MKLHEIADNLDQRIAQIQRSIDLLQKDMQYADDPTRERQQLARLEDELRQLERQKGVQSGDMLSVSIPIRADDAKEVHRQLQQLWKIKPGFDVPWHMYHGKAPDTIDVRIEGKPSYRHGGITVQDVADFVKKYAV